MHSLLRLSAELPGVFGALVFITGTMVGSFLNVCILRIPAGLSVVSPGSRCACGKPIRWFDNVPVLSWIFLRGTTRCCSKPFSFRYPCIELLTGLLFLACWFSFSPAKAVCGMAFVSVLVCASVIDLDHFILPDRFTLGLCAAGIVLSIVFPELHNQRSPQPIRDSLIGAKIALIGLSVGTAFLLWTALFAEAVLKKEAMGFGDIKLLGAIGTFLGWQGAVSTVFIGSLVGLAWFVSAVAWQLVSGRKIALRPVDPEAPANELGLGAEIPFGPLLAIGAILYFLRLHSYVDPFFARVASVIGS